MRVGTGGRPPELSGPAREDSLVLFLRGGGRAWLSCLLALAAPSSPLRAGRGGGGDASPLPQTPLCREAFGNRCARRARLSALSAGRELLAQHPPRPPNFMAAPPRRTLPDQARPMSRHNLGCMGMRAGCRAPWQGSTPALGGWDSDGKGAQDPCAPAGVAAPLGPPGPRVGSPVPKFHVS